MKNTLLLLLVLLVVPSVSADPVTCETVLPSGDAEGKTKITLRSNTFWDTAPGHHQYSEDIRKQVNAFTAAMPAALKHTSVATDRLRAEQLQWALAFANELQALAEQKHLPPHSVELTLNPCYYDFSDVGAHQDTGTADPDLANLLPKLVLRRDNLTILGLAHPTVLGYDRPSTIPCTASGRGCHGRVLMLVPRGLTAIKLLRLTFQGSHDASQFFVPEQYLHENHFQLSPTGKTRYGMLMIGYDPPPIAGINKILVNGCVFKKVNLRAIELSGNAEILGNRFEGALPPPTGAPSSSYINSLSCFTNPEQDICAALPPRDNLYSVSERTLFGMNWHSAISFRDYVVASVPTPTIIENNTIQDFVEGIVGGWLPDGSKIRSNTIRRIADHGFYSLGSVKRGNIDSNVFERILNASIKIGGDSKRREPLTEEGSMAAFQSSISFNQFRLIGSSAILMAGTSNTVEGNVHDPLDDPTDWFDLDGFPFIWITTYGGNTSPDSCGYYNHSAHNLIKNNQAPRADIFVQQYDDPEVTCSGLSGDRSIEGNEVSGPGQVVYERARATSQFGTRPHVTVSDGSTRVQGCPPDCSPCKRNRLGPNGHLATCL